MKLKFLGIVFIFLFSLVLSGCSFFDAKEKSFSADNNELTITLTEDFEQSGNLNSTSSYTTGLKFTNSDNSVLVQIFKWSKESFDGFEEINLTEFINIVSSSNINYDKDNMLCYTDEYTSGEIFVKTFAFKTNSAYYEAIFKYVKSQDKRIFNWAKSIKFSEDIVYDIDETIMETKKIVLDNQDQATINIDATYIKLENSNNIYQKVLLTGQVHRTQFEFSKESKSSSSYDNLTEYANSRGYANRNLSGKDYISLVGSAYVYGVGSCEVVMYCFESDVNFYMVKFISNNSDIQLFDSYADTFTFN